MNVLTRPTSTRGVTKIPPRVHFIRAAYALATAHVRGGDPERFLTGADPEVARSIIARTAVVPGSTTGSGWAAGLARDSFRDFLGDLAQYSGASRLIAQAVPATLNRHSEAHYPVRTSGRLVPAWVAELDAIPVVEGVFANVTIGPAKKMSHIIVWSDEVAKRSDARNIFERMLKEDCAAGVDSAFFATTAGTSAAHAGLLYGVSAMTGYAGGDRTAMDWDLVALAEAVSDGGSGSVTFVVNPKRLARMRIKAPDIVEKADIVASAAVPVDRVIAADGPSLLVAVDPAPDISASQHAAIHMSNVPLPISDSGISDPIRSLWQSGSTAFRVIHELAFAKRRSTAVAYLDGATW